MTAVLQVATPEGDSGKVLASGADYLFRYHEDAEVQSAISLLMPVRLEEYRHRELHPIFQMNLPEGYVLEQLRNRLAKVANLDPMLLLALSGSSWVPLICRSIAQISFGRVQFLSTNERNSYGQACCSSFGSHQLPDSWARH